MFVRWRYLLSVMLIRQHHSTGAETKAAIMKNKTKAIFLGKMHNNKIFHQ